MVWSPSYSFSSGISLVLDLNQREYRVSAVVTGLAIAYLLVGSLAKLWRAVRYGDYSVTSQAFWLPRRWQAWMHGSRDDRRPKISLLCRSPAALDWHLPTPRDGRPERQRLGIYRSADLKSALKGELKGIQAPMQSSGQGLRKSQKQTLEIDSPIFLHDPLLPIHRLRGKGRYR